ncbi:hypothetical protein L208DRAFT_1517457, partial [Tricholoma matsutake]
NKLEFLIKWKNYTDKNNLWEPKDNCKRVHNGIELFTLPYVFLEKSWESLIQPLSTKWFVPGCFSSSRIPGGFLV